MVQAATEIVASPLGMESILNNLVSMQTVGVIGGVVLFASAYEATRTSIPKCPGPDFTLEDIANSTRALNSYIESKRQQSIDRLLGQAE